MAIVLKQYQKEAVEMAVKEDYNMICIQAGRGKSLVGAFYARVLFKHNLVDKIIYASTKTGVGSIKKAFTKRCGVPINQYDDPSDVMNFLISDEKVCVVKHSMFEKLGLDETYRSSLRTLMTHHYQRIALVIDEAHIVTTWGKSFRADYWYLGTYLQKLRKNKQFPIATFTATAISAKVVSSVSPLR